MIAVWTTIWSDAFASRPVISDERRTGETRKRSMTPRSRSSIIGMPLQPAVKNAVITTTPGARNWM